MKKALAAGLLMTMFAATYSHSARATDSMDAQHPYAHLSGEVVLDNDRVLARRFFVEPGQTTGAHLHKDPELIVYVKGGILKSESSGRSVLWRDGRVAWVPSSPTADESTRNVGKTTMHFVQVVLKPYASREAASGKVYTHLNYPNIPTEDLFENDLVIVQRFQMQPGQREGIHAHPANTLYVFVKGGSGGHWVSTTTNPPSRVVGYSPDGDVGWMQLVDLSAGHQSGNTGTSPSDVVWIALKDPA